MEPINSPGPFVNLKRVALFRVLTEEQLQQVGLLMRERRYPSGEVLFHQGDEGGHLYLLALGRVRVYLTSTDGREVTLRIYKPGSYFGEFAVLDGAPRLASSAALDDVVTYVLYRDDFMQLMQESFPLVMNVIAALTERARYTTIYTEQLTFFSVPQRIAATLLYLTYRLEPDGEGIRLKLTQQELAHLANTTREWSTGRCATSPSAGRCGSSAGPWLCLTGTNCNKF
ncbi:MAG: Crp/Fnr family transcriptional regulator [Blastochloris sp.]|nr:Crp/Fnr family transcriptional regulator [Blastochloris sp.]